MSNARRAILLLAACALLLVGTIAAQEPEWVILNAQYGNEHNHVDVTARLRDVAHARRTFYVNHDSMAADPDPGHPKWLRIFARGPNGQERMFEFADNSLVDGVQFRGWDRGDFGNEAWQGGWSGRGGFLILTAQYGSERRHVDVTGRLRELAHENRQVWVDFRTFHVDPDEGHAKVLRIYARGPNGRERMFEFRDGQMIDGAQFRGWSTGEWAGSNDRWSGRWEGEEREEREHERQ